MGKWTNETKKQAIDLLNNGSMVDDIAKKFNMSKNSVILLKYSLLDNKDRIKCLVCGLEFKQLTIKHLASHNMSIDQYKEKFPNSPMYIQKRADAYKNFKSPNKGKTYEEIYGREEAQIKKNKISQNQIGRPCPNLAGTGISGTRKDTNVFARSTYEANIDRIFILENKKFKDEIYLNNNRFELVRENGEKTTYCPDRFDEDGLFEKNSYLEIKGYMYPEDWEKIILFRKQYCDKKLLVISPDKSYYDVDYKELENKYKDKIELWEGEKQNYKTRPDLYQIGYKTPEHVKFLQDNYPNHISVDIKDRHLIFIANRCLSFNKVSLGKNVYVDKIELIAITDKRFGASKKSCGEYNYELWKVITLDKKIFYVSNQKNATLFYSYQEDRFNDLMRFFDNNMVCGLKYGRKYEKIHEHIDDNLWNNSDEHKKEILQMINDKINHAGNFYEIIEEIKLTKTEKSKNGSLFDYEEWKIFCKGGKTSYILSNFGHATFEFKMIEILA